METVRDNLSYLNPMTLVPIQVVTSVRRAVNAANLPASIEVFMENLESLPAVTGGERNLALVFTNLLENASSAMNGKGIITFRGSSRAGWVEIAVSDNGSGIPPELHDQIFEFHYSGRSAGRQGKLGFGLWWVKTVMTRLGGSISVESDGSHGSTFRLRLPIAKET
jgi:signal transduction histidine kinase